MYSTPGCSSCARIPVRAIEDLRGKPVAFGAQGSGLVILARYVLDGLGLDRDRDFKAVFLERAGDGPAMVLGRPRGGAVGRRHRLAGIHDDGERTGRRALHRARRGRHRADPRQARLPAAA
jgi:hypothetical protein